MINGDRNENVKFNQYRFLKKHDNTFARASLDLFLVQCTSWYDGDKCRYTF